MFLELKGLLQDQTKALVLLSETPCQEFSIFKPKKFSKSKTGYTVRIVAESYFLPEAMRVPSDPGLAFHAPVSGNT